jgi:hypothetical protein
MENLIPADEFCANHNIEISFIRTLQETGLIEITTIEETGYINASHMNWSESFAYIMSWILTWKA